MRRCKERTNISQPQGMPVPDQIVNFKTKAPLEHQPCPTHSASCIPSRRLCCFSLQLGKNSVPFFPIFPLHAAEITMRDLTEAQVTRRSSRAQQSGPVTVDRTKPRRLLLSRAFPASLHACGIKQARSANAARSYCGITARRKAGRRPVVAQVFATCNEVVEAQQLFAISLRSAM